MAENGNDRSDQSGGDSPASREPALQGRAGAEGGPRAAQTQGDGGQPRQGSGRTEAGRGQGSGAGSFEPGRAPSEQGEKDHPSPHVIAQHQQGAEPRSGSHMQGDRSQEEATSGEPRSTHTRSGRDQTPGDRSN